jgi:hypothetical protein
MKTKCVHTAMTNQYSTIGFERDQLNQVWKNQRETTLRNSWYHFPTWYQIKSLFRIGGGARLG